MDELTRATIDKVKADFEACLADEESAMSLTICLLYLLNKRGVSIREFLDRAATIAELEIGLSPALQIEGGK